MRLLDISCNYLSDSSGDIAGIHVHRQNLLLKEKGWDIRVIAPQPFLYRRYKRRAQYYPYTSKRDSISIWRPRYLRLPFVDPSIAQERRYAAALIRASRQVCHNWKPNLVVCDWIVPGGLGAAIIANKYNVPLVFKAHGNDVRTICARAGAAQSAWEYYKGLMSKARWIICNGQGLYDDVERLEALESTRLLNIPIGVDTTIFHKLGRVERTEKRSAYGISSEAVIWIFVGTWIDYKGTADMVAVIPKLLSQFKQAYFIVVGPVKDVKSRAQLEHTISNGGNSRVRFLGAIPPDKVSEWMQLSDVLLLPSYKEGLPSALLEAMAAGTVPIASSVGGIPDVIQHGVNGLLIRPGDIQALTSALVTCTMDPVLLEQLSVAAQATIHQQGYSLSSVGKMLHGVFLSEVEGSIE